MNLKHPLILASSSPRRRFLMTEIGFQFTTASPDVDESFPESMPITKVPHYLAEKKAAVFLPGITNELVITSDTIVILGNKVLNKPLDREEAINMLRSMSGTTHSVITAVCLMSREKKQVFEVTSHVKFNQLELADIEKYVDHNKPFDKAGAYGAQECLPPGVNPCSEEEISFLRSINKFDLVQKSVSPAGAGLLAIEKIEGSYFNVMGLPIHKVYQQIKQF